MPPWMKILQFGGRLRHIAGASIIKQMFELYREGMRIILRHPLISVNILPLTEDGKIVLIKRTGGSWSLPGGMVSYNETVAQALERELLEETGLKVDKIERVIGIYSAPDRDSRFHAINIAVAVLVKPGEMRQKNRIEVRDVRAFSPENLPENLAHDCREQIEDYFKEKECVLK